MSSEKVILTRAQKRELLIMGDYGSITTSGYGRRQRLCEALVKMGLANQGGPGFGNMFTLTETGRKYYNTQQH